MTVPIAHVGITTSEEQAHVRGDYHRRDDDEEDKGNGGNSADDGNDGQAIAQTTGSAAQVLEPRDTSTSRYNWDSSYQHFLKDDTEQIWFGFELEEIVAMRITSSLLPLLKSGSLFGRCFFVVCIAYDDKIKACFSNIRSCRLRAFAPPGLRADAANFFLGCLMQCNAIKYEDACPVMIESRLVSLTFAVAA
ncbi:hypothetical protein PR202_ga17671 [Eleusine coracana subsp. coracana]|uniref:Uncharacterized protein n=1 Tax=Eleusine coracana subsp. coracana TaxID=191504 RepID=A0AAV5CP36_ELECO|nr:hypothetical protein PR202_ga17424 [Eleusine coracana subsp. coracana]GJN00485.1 hypothetical protein PR202_ga17671 [Eleusine coracana subsp. coracana]